MVNDMARKRVLFAHIGANAIATNEMAETLSFRKKFTTAKWRSLHSRPSTHSIEWVPDRPAKENRGSSTNNALLRSHRVYRNRTDRSRRPTSPGTSLD